MRFSPLRTISGLLGCGLALALTGCGMGLNEVQTNVASGELNGRLMGGQQPLIGSVIGVYQYGTGGYGSAATLLASTTTDSTGSFSFASGAYTCPQSNTPVYLLSSGGDPGVGQSNPNAVLAAVLGTCTNAKQSYVNINEITTVAAAYALANFFNTSYTTAASNGGVTGDNFGGPSSTSGSVVTYSRGLVLGSNTTAGLIANVATGNPMPSTSTMTTESTKVSLLGNILAACVNSTGQSGTSDATSNCGKLFTATTYSSRPNDTLQAAVAIAKNPTQNVGTLFAIPPTQPAFAAALATQPNDFSLAISFTTSSFGLGVDTNTIATIDTDSSNRVWFPSNASGQVGIGYFDVTSQSFNGPYNGAGLTHPQQIAIDGNGYAWVTDTQSTKVAGINTTAPSTYSVFTLANSTSYAVSIDSNSQVRIGSMVGTAPKLGTIDSAHTAYTVTGSPSGIAASYIPQSIASDNGSNLIFTGYNSSVPRFYDYYVVSGATSTSQKGFANDLAGQSAWTGGDLVGVKAYNNGGASYAVDGLCFIGNGACASMAGNKTYNRPTGISVDGTGTLWLAYNQTASVASVPQNSGTGRAYSNYINSAGQFTSYVLNHNSSYGNTLTNPEGISVDNEGNIWVANSGCLTTSCTPGSFTLTLFPGQAYPTITPVSAQIASGAALAGTAPSY